LQNIREYLHILRSNITNTRCVLCNTINTLTLVTFVQHECTRQQMSQVDSCLNTVNSFSQNIQQLSSPLWVQISR